MYVYDVKLISYFILSNLWYCDDFDFLRDLEMPGRLKLSSDENKIGFFNVVGNTKHNCVY